jgi:AraC-like DNA-binding protein
MIKSYTFSLGGDYKIVSCPRQAITFPIRHAQQQHWESPHNQVSEQTFDGRFAYLYSYEYWIKEAMDIPIEITLEDLHLIYPLFSQQTIFAKQAEADFVVEILPNHGSYFYLPRGQYNLHLPVGHHILIGFVIDAGMFRPPALQHFRFLAPLIQAQKERSPFPIKSVGFRVGSTTTEYLQLVFSRLNPYMLDNEYILLKHLIFLVNLSRFKLLEQESNLPLPEQARQLLELSIVQEGAQARLKDIAKALRIAHAALSRKYHAYHGVSMLADRNKLLLQHIGQLLIENEKQAVTAELAGFAGVSEMNRFICRMSGMTTAQYKKHIEDQPHK